MALTARVVQQAKPAEKRYDLIDKDGLMLRVNPGGTKTWRLRYKLNGKTEILVLGTTSDLTLAEAREKVADARKLIRAGISPAAEAQRKKNTRRRMPTVAEFAREEYIERYAKPNKKSWYKDEQMLERWVIPQIGKVKLGDVHRRDVVAVLDKIHEAGHKRVPSNVFAVVRRMFRFAVERGVIEISPAVHISEPQPAAQTHALTADEIRHWWKCTGDPALAQPQARLGLRTILLTGQRPGEVATMREEELDLDAGLWGIPQERRKRGATGQVHYVPLTKTAIATIREALETCAAEGYVFPNRAGKAGMRTDGPPNTALKRYFKGMPHSPTPHDARRTVATELGDALEFPDEVVARVLGHYPKNVTQQYIKRGTQRAKTALEAWEARLLEIVGEGLADDNVVPLRPADMEA